MSESLSERRPGGPWGTRFTPSMMTAQYTPEAGWQSPVIGERRSLLLDPATAVLHYGQAAFEGLMAHRQLDGGWALFRAREHAERLAGSCRRMAIPPPDVDETLESWRRYVRHEVEHLPADAPASIYLRPLVFASDAAFGDRPSDTYTMILQGVLVDRESPPRPDRLEVLIIDQHVRSASGGVGSAKVPGNYGAGMLARQVAAEAGCDQVLWLDAGRRRWIEELGSLNVAFVLSEVVVTPLATDTILAGVTRATLLTLCEELGVECESRPIALEEITAAMTWRGLSEAIGCGTAAGIVSIGAFRMGERRLELPAATPVADLLRELLHEHQHGRRQNPHGWLFPV